MATNTKNVAFRDLGDVFTPDRYSGEDLYNKSQTTDKNTRVKNYLKEGLADILTFAGGALTNLYSPMGLAAGLGAVAQRHGAMNEARQDYVNKLNNNLMLYDQATGQGFRPSITRDQVTGNTDLSLIMPKDGNKYWDMQTNQDTIAHQNDIYGAGAGQTQETYNNELGSNQINTSPITTNLPTMQELTLDTTPKTNALPESPVINTLANNGDYGNFDVNFNQTPLLQGNIQQQSAPYLVNPDLYKTFYKTGVDNVEGARGERYNYYKTNENLAMEKQKLAQDYALGQQRNAIAMYKATHPTANNPDGLSFNNVASLRKEFTSLPPVKNATEITRQYNNVQSLYNQYTQGKIGKNAFDQALLVTLQKVLDPTSVVRESEFDRTAAGQATWDKLTGYYSKLTQGGSGLTDANRADLLNSLVIMKRANDNEVRSITNDYADLARKYNVDPSMVMPRHYNKQNNAQQNKGGKPSTPQGGFDF